MEGKRRKGGGGGGREEGGRWRGEEEGGGGGEKIPGLFLPSSAFLSAGKDRLRYSTNAIF